MSLAEKLLREFEKLPYDKKVEVLDYVEFLKSRDRKSLSHLMDEIINQNITALKELAK